MPAFHQTWRARFLTESTPQMSLTISVRQCAGIAGTLRIFWQAFHINERSCFGKHPKHDASTENPASAPPGVLFFLELRREELALESYCSIGSSGDAPCALCGLCGHEADVAELFQPQAKARTKANHGG